MLRITNTDTPTEQQWILSGELAGPWAAELLTNWARTRIGSQEKFRLVDLTEVTFIDEGGENVLRTMKGEGAHFVARGVATRHLVEGLEERGKGPLRRSMSYLLDEKIEGGKDG